MSSAARILIVGDDADVALALAQALRRRLGALECVVAHAQASLDEALQRNRFDLVVLDQRLGWATWQGVHQATRGRADAAAVVLVAAGTSDALAEEAARLGLDGFLASGDTAALAFTVRALLRRREPERVRRVLQEQLLFQAALLNAVGDAIIAASPAGVILYCNDAAERVYGWPRDELLGRPLEDALGIAGASRHPGEVLRAVRAGSAWAGELAARRKDGGSFITQLVATPVHDTAGEVNAIIAVCRDVSGLRAAKTAAADSEEDLRALIDALPDGIAVFAGERYELVNPAYARALGTHPGALIGRSLGEVLPEAQAAAVRTRLGRALTDGAGVLQDQYELLTADGRLRLLEDTTARIGAGAKVLSVLRDVTGRQQLQAQRMVADRMTSVGTLAAGVAHELNNPLAYVIANVAFAADELHRLGQPRLAEDRAAAEEVEAALREAREGADRMRAIVRELMGFSRFDDAPAQPVDVHRVIESAVSLTSAELRGRAALVKELAPVPLVLGDQARLGQVLVNLLVNAAHALPERGDAAGQIRVTTERLPDGNVAVRVGDTGCGIPPDVLPRIFDPFFTTKPVGAGTGLGLSMCHNIVRALGGSIEVTSRQGEGSTFTVILPAAQEQPDLLAAPVAGSARTGRLLIIDDEPMILSVFRRVLGTTHEVITASRAEEGLTRLRRGERFDLIFCDVVMPGMTGMDFDRAVREQRLATVDRVVYMTGGAFTHDARAFLAQLPNARLEKPFDAETLRAFVSTRLPAVAPPGVSAAG